MLRNDVCSINCIPFHVILFSLCFLSNIKFGFAYSYMSRCYLHLLHCFITSGSPAALDKKAARSIAALAENILKSEAGRTATGFELLPLVSAGTGATRRSASKKPSVVTLDTDDEEVEVSGSEKRSRHI